MGEPDCQTAACHTPSTDPAAWLRYAEQWHDASRFLGDRGHFSHACEGARHCVELALKAVLVHRGVEQPFEVTGLLLLAKEIGGDLPPELRSALVKLDHYWYYATYPSDLIPRPSEYYEEPEATEAVTMARRLIDWARARLPEHFIAVAGRDNPSPEDP